MLRVKICLHGNLGAKKKTIKKAIQNLVSMKYKLRFGDLNPSLNQRKDIFPLHKDIALSK